MRQRMRRKDNDYIGHFRVGAMLTYMPALALASTIRQRAAEMASAATTVAVSVMFAVFALGFQVTFAQPG